MAKLLWFKWVQQSWHSNYMIIKRQQIVGDTWRSHRAQIFLDLLIIQPALISTKDNKRVNMIQSERHLESKQLPTTRSIRSCSVLSRSCINQLKSDNWCCISSDVYQPLRTCAASLLLFRGQSKANTGFSYCPLPMKFFLKYRGVKSANKGLNSARCPLADYA